MLTSKHASMYAASQEYYRMEKLFVIAGYVRNSDPSKKDAEVLKAQANALRAYAMTMYGVSIPDSLLYQDAISSLKFPYWERSGLMRLWDDAERGLFNIVLCTEFIRLARKSSEQYAIMEYLKRYKVEVVSITEKFEDTAEGRLLHAVQGFLGEVEAEKIRLRTLRGKAHRASQALTGQGSTPVYGYTFVDGKTYKKERYTLNQKIIAVIDGEAWTEVRVIEYCFACCLQGMSTRKIALSLTKMGIPTHKGKPAWSRLFVRQILKREAYTGVGYNGLWTKDPETGKLTDAHIVRLPDGIYPKIIEPEDYERVQLQLERNAEMSPRNNKHPLDTIMRGMIYCGICGRKMHVKHWNKPKPGRKKVKPPYYACHVNRGVEEVYHHHSTSYAVHKADSEAWAFAVPYIKNPTLVREHIEQMKGQIVQRNHSQDIEGKLDKINKAIANLYKLAEVADPTNEEGMRSLQDRLITNEREKRELEKLLSDVSVDENKQEKLLAALDRFEAWANTVRPFLDDPTYEISHLDKVGALMILGVKMKVYLASEEYPDRTVLTLMPPDVKRFCDGDFVQLLYRPSSSRSICSTSCL